MKGLFLPKGFSNPPQLLRDLKTKPEKYWIKKGEARALHLFHQMAKRVPAYKDFLRKQKVNPNKIKTTADFKRVPLISKDSYLKKYPLEKMCWDGEFKKTRWTFAATSGTTGEPFYFPRKDFQDRQYAVTAELYLRENFGIHKKTTLYINGFAMGIWIGGLFTYQAIKLVADRGDYHLSIITPGISKVEIIKAVENLGHKFDQVLIGGYPPFVKDTIDDGIAAGLDWKDYNLGFIFSAEAFTERFRDYIIENAGLKSPYRDTLNHYGTVDLGTMSHETPLSILMRRLAVDDSRLKQTLFSDVSKEPTLTQFLPELFYFEDLNGDLICSAFSGLPLVRYDLKDRGGVFTLKDVSRDFLANGVDLHQEAREGKIDDTIWNLPFVYVYERRDLSTTLYGLNIYPETVRKALQDKSLEPSVTGKFTMMTKFDENLNQYLEINVELKDKEKEDGGVGELIQRLIVNKLREENSEYRKLYEELPERARPKIVCWPYEDPLYFKPGIKQKWVIKKK